MNLLNACKLFVVAVFLSISGFSFSEDVSRDNLYVFVFKDGMAQPGVTIKVGETSEMTDAYGLANFSLPGQIYEIGYYQDDQLFALTEVDLANDLHSQVFLNLTKDAAQIELDMPLSAYRQRFEQAEIQEQSGPKGTLELLVKNQETDQPVVNARLFFKGYSVEATTDEQGIARVELSEGNYDISLVHPGYVMQVLKDVSVKADKTQQQQVEMLPSDITLEEYVVTAPAVEGSLASTFTELRESNVIADALSSEEFSKSGDSTAADALKRVTGITIVDGKFVYVRGLGERYSVVLLNDLHIPSPEPTKRVVPLDIFPSSVIQSMNIQKTWAADLPGTFAGGDVLIESKDIPKEDNYVELSLGTTFHERTGDSFKANADNSKGLPADIINKSADFQELQLGFPNLGVPGYTREELDAINSAIVNYRHYNLQNTELKPGQKIAVDAGQSFRTSGGMRYGFVGTLYASTDENTKEATKFDTFYDIPNAILTAGERSEYQQTEISEKLGGLLSVAIGDDDKHQVKYTFLAFSDNNESTTFSQKDGGPAGPGIDDEERSYLSYVEQNLMVHQLSGEHYVDVRKWLGDHFQDIELTWDIEKAEATRYEPGTVEYTYEKTSNDTDFTLNKDIWFLYSDLEDKVDNARVDIKLPYRVNGLEHFTRIGLFKYSKDRTLDNRRFKAEHSLGTDVFTDIDSVFTQETVDNDDLVLTSNYRSADAYTAKQDVDAFYISQLVSLSKDLELLAGVRMESSTQELIDTETGVPYAPLETDDTLPAVALNYSINDKHKIRFAYASTLSRPDFREFSPNRFKDPITEDIVFGFPELDYTTIENLDLKYEWYISYDEMFSVGLFHKDFTNPIETVINIDTNSQAGNKIVTYRNATGATSSGIEFGLRKRLGFVSNTLDDYFLSMNFASIDSTIELDKNSSDRFIQELTTTDRPMQGQSPYVLNLNIGYDNINTGRSAVLAFNQYGERIVALGSFGAPDYYEQPFAKLDFVLKWRLNDTYDDQVKKIGYGIGLKVTNLLDSTKEIQQGDQLVESYRPGRSFHLSFSMKY
jgi:TonB-dependent receptor